MIESLRKLALSNHWQFLYSKAKEMGNIRLFKNSIGFSKIQILFLQYLDMYSGLYHDLATKNYQKDSIKDYGYLAYISKEVILDNIRCDSYLLYKSKQKEPEKADGTQIKEGKIQSVIFNKRK